MSLLIFTLGSAVGSCNGKTFALVMTMANVAGRCDDGPDGASSRPPGVLCER